MALRAPVSSPRARSAAAGAARVARTSSSSNTWSCRLRCEVMPVPYASSRRDEPALVDRHRTRTAIMQTAALFRAKYPQTAARGLRRNAGGSADCGAGLAAVGDAAVFRRTVLFGM